MDLALHYDPATGEFDLSIDAATGDFAREDTLTTAVMLSLLCDRTAQAHEVPAGQDRRGWWADAFAQASEAATAADAFGSRLWLLAREKQTPATEQRLRGYIDEALRWMVEDGLAQDLAVTVFRPRIGWYTALVDLRLSAGSRRYRFEWDTATQVLQLAGEAFQ
jgi:phage gp46-like protein